MRKLLTYIITATAMLCGAVILPVSASAKDFTVVIDPGHGGKDNGAPGKLISEKSINLAVAKKLSAMIKEKMPDVKVVMTRDDDSFVTLQGRADIANKASGDLFISIHTNSIDKKAKNHSTVAGASVYTLGFLRSEENLSVAMRENEVMKLESDYSTVYEGFDPSSTESYIIFEMSQNKHMDQSILAASAIQKELVGSAKRQDRGVRQANFWVLFKTVMPAILVELDFICNPNQEKFMASEAGQNKLAKAIFDGFSNYKRAADHQRKAFEDKSITPPTKSKASAKSKNAGKTTKRGAEKSAAEPASKNNSSTRRTAPATPTYHNTSRLIMYSDFTLYKIQFLQTSSGTPLVASSPELKGLTGVEYTEDNQIIKYYVGGFYTIEEARKYLVDVRKLFADAFIVEVTSQSQSQFKPLGSDGTLLNMPMGRPQAEYAEAPRLLAQARAEARVTDDFDDDQEGTTETKYFAKDTNNQTYITTSSNGYTDYGYADYGYADYEYADNTATASVSTTRKRTTVSRQNEDNDNLIYKIQFLISTRRLQADSPKFKGLKDVDSYVDDNIIKYTTGEFTSNNEAIQQLKEVRKLFKDAFIIKTKNGQRIK